MDRYDVHTCVECKYCGGFQTCTNQNGPGRQRCESGVDCLGKCDVGKGICTTNGTGGPCSDDKACKNKACDLSSGRCVLGGTGVSCNADGDCSVKRCAGASCAPGGTGQPCENDAKCAALKTCNGLACVNGEYSNVSCQTNAECAKVTDPIDYTKWKYCGAGGTCAVLPPGTYANGASSCLADADCKYKRCQMIEDKGVVSATCVMGGGGYDGGRVCGTDADCKATTCGTDLYAGICMQGGGSSNASCSENEECFHKVCNSRDRLYCDKQKSPGQNMCETSADCDRPVETPVPTGTPTSVPTMPTPPTPTSTPTTTPTAAPSSTPTTTHSVTPTPTGTAIPQTTPTGTSVPLQRRSQMKNSSSPYWPRDFVAKLEGNAFHEPKLLPAEKAFKLLSKVDASHASIGEPEAPILIHLFQDLKCSMCKAAMRDMFPRLKKEFLDTGKARLVFMDFPMGKEERILAEASRCANEEQLYLPFLETSFANLKEGAQALNIRFAERFVGKVGHAFSTCVEAKRYEESVRADLLLAAQLGVNGTPTFFLNGKAFVGAQPFENLRKALLVTKPRPQILGSRRKGGRRGKENVRTEGTQR